MLRAQVAGTAVSTVHHPSMKGWRLVICQPVDDQGTAKGEPIIAIDPYQAGHGQFVIVTSDGKATSERVGKGKSPLRNMIIAIEDDSEETAAGKETA